jgi:lipoprotein-anchoring transpeptidase ErfK/SrfK
MRLHILLRAAFLGALLAMFAVTTASAGVLVNINKTTQRMDVSVDGKHRYTWKVSTGKFGYWTPSGTYTPFRMERTHFSTEWDDAPMPHSIFFTTRGHAIHGSYHTRRLGRAVSHGCVRLAPGNARTLFALVSQKGMGNTRIVVTGGVAGGLPEEFAPIGREVKKLVPKVKKQFGDWLQDVGR